MSGIWDWDTMGFMQQVYFTLSVLTNFHIFVNEYIIVM